MPLETGTTIESLDSSWPLGGDPHNKGDDHIRLVKHVLQAQFPGVDGNGFKAAITATEQEINWLGGLSSNAQDQLDALSVRIDSLEGVLSAPAGTALTFYQAVPPTGWTLDATNNDYMLRVVSTSGGASGGSDSPILNGKVASHTHSMGQSGAHAHTVSAASVPGDWLLGYFSGGITMSSTNVSRTTSTSATHSHTVNANAGSNWTPKYLNVIIATKD